MCAADVPARHEKIIYVSGIQTTIRHGIRINPPVYSLCFKFITRKTFGIQGIGKMQINTPGGGERSIFMRHILVQIILCQNIITQ
ncbi:hypothetical protein SDC9_208443 [bioreactor metagenome]|uniref:Uncharacterized protein n=1 Tax=bioreactor metagenome TaxID=1076179 RepID=A0A645JC34_9ZZZZ